MANLDTYADSLISPARSQKAVTPDDDNDLPDGVCKSLEVVATGDVVCIAEEDTVAATRSAVAAGTIIPVRVRRVMEATTATVLALY